MMRLVAVQRCPVVPKAPQSPPSIARSRLASSSTIMGFLPPSSSEQCLKLLAAVAPTILPTAEEPVREIARTTGCSVRGVPTSVPNPVTMLMTPFGTPASVSACTRLKVESGVSCAGLITQVLPQTTAGKSFQEEMAMGKFQGVIMPQTPMGWRTAMANLLGKLGGHGGTKEAAAFSGVVVGGVDGLLDIAARFFEDLAHFAGHVAGVVFFALDENFGGAEDHLGAPWARGRDAILRRRVWRHRRRRRHRSCWSAGIWRRLRECRRDCGLRRSVRWRSRPIRRR